MWCNNLAATDPLKSHSTWLPLDSFEGQLVDHTSTLLPWPTWLLNHLCAVRTSLKSYYISTLMTSALRKYPIHNQHEQEPPSSTVIPITQLDWECWSHLRIYTWMPDMNAPTFLRCLFAVNFKISAEFIPTFTGQVSVSSSYFPQYFCWWNGEVREEHSTTKEFIDNWYCGLVFECPRV